MKSSASSKGSIQSGEIEDAIKVASMLFALTKTGQGSESNDETDLALQYDATPSIDFFEYERLIREIREDFIAGTAFRGFEFLCDLLETVTKYSEGDFVSEKRDYSYIWRRAIEDHSQDTAPSIRNSIVTAVRDSAIQLASKNRSMLIDVIKSLEKREWSIFLRISLNTLRECAPKRFPTVSSHLTSRRWMYAVELHHEYWMLLHDRFKYLTDRQRESVINTINAGPDKLDESNGLSIDDAVQLLECQQARVLSAIQNELSGKLLKWFKSLIAKGRLAENPEFLMYTTSKWGFSSPITQSNLLEMLDKDLIEYLITEKFEQSWDSRLGLARTFEDLVHSEPTRFVKLAKNIKKLKPTYVCAFLSAYRGSARDGNSFQWEPILQLAAWAVRQIQSGSAQVDNLADLDSGWDSTRSTIAHLLEEGLNNSKLEIPFKLRSLVWSILELLVDDQNPSVEDESKYGGANMDPTTLSMNTVRGQAIRSVMKYAIWTHRNLEQSGESQDINGFSRMPEVKEVLEKHLDTSLDPSFAVRSIYGELFSWLQFIDNEWCKVNVHRIFPPDDNDFLYWEAAWDSYIAYCQPSKGVFEILKDEYARAIRRISIASPDRKHPMSMNNFAQHLMVLYIWGQIELDDALLIQFFKIQSVEQHASALSFLGRSLYEIRDNAVHAHKEVIPNEMVLRARVLWEGRLQTAQEHQNQFDIGKELEEFGWWFVAPDFDDKWSLDQLIAVLKMTGFVQSSHLVVQRLARTVSTEPKLSLEALQLMLRGDKVGWQVNMWKKSIDAVLRAARKCPDTGVRGAATELVHELGTRGFREFRSILADD